MHTEHLPRSPLFSLPPAACLDLPVLLQPLDPAGGPASAPGQAGRDHPGCSQLLRCRGACGVVDGAGLRGVDRAEVGRRRSRSRGRWIVSSRRCVAYIPRLMHSASGFPHTGLAQVQAPLRGVGLAYGTMLFSICYYQY